jgi:hypothetical protein
MTRPSVLAASVARGTLATLTAAKGTLATRPGQASPTQPCREGHFHDTQAPANWPTAPLNLKPPMILLPVRVVDGFRQVEPASRAPGAQRPAPTRRVRRCRERSARNTAHVANGPLTTLNVPSGPLTTPPMSRTVRSPHRRSTIRDTEHRALRTGPRSGPAQPHLTSPPAAIIGGSRLNVPKGTNEASHRRHRTVAPLIFRWVRAR